MSENAPARQGRVLVADTNVHMLRGVHALLESVFDTTVMVSDERSLLQTAENCRKDICIVDLLFPVTAEANVILLIRKRFPAAADGRIELYDEPSVAQEAIAQGAMAFVLKRTALADLVPAIEAVRRGQTYVSPFVRPQLRGPPGFDNEARLRDLLDEPRQGDAPGE